MMVKASKELCITAIIIKKMKDSKELYKEKLILDHINCILHNICHKLYNKSQNCCNFIHLLISDLYLTFVGDFLVTFIFFTFLYVTRFGTYQRF